METVAGFDTPEEAALQLELPLLGTLPAPEAGEGVIAPAFPTEERERREYHRAADRLLLSPHSRGGSIGLLGDVSPAHRALVAARLAASVAAERTAILVDADVRGAHLSFDSNDRAQEGLVDVLRYGVRSPRVVAPTQTPGLNLLPVGAGTVDLEGTFGTEAVAQVFEELAASGDLLLINGPDLRDLHAAARLVSEVDAWILIHELKRSDANKTRALRDTFGREKCVGVLAIEFPVVEEPEVEDVTASDVADVVAATAVGGTALAAGAALAGGDEETPLEIAEDAKEEVAASLDAGKDEVVASAAEVEEAIADASEDSLEITHGSGLPDLEPIVEEAKEGTMDAADEVRTELAAVSEDVPLELEDAAAAITDSSESLDLELEGSGELAEVADEIADRIDEPPLPVEEPDAPTSEAEARELERRYAPQAVDRGDGFISANEPEAEDQPALKVPRPRPSAPSEPMAPPEEAAPAVAETSPPDEPAAAPVVESSESHAAPSEPRFAAESVEAERSGRGLWLVIGGVTIAALLALLWFQLRSPDSPQVAANAPRGTAPNETGAVTPVDGTSTSGTASDEQDAEAAADVVRPNDESSGSESATNSGTSTPPDSEPSGGVQTTPPAGGSSAGGAEEIAKSASPSNPAPVTPPERATPGGRFGVHLSSVKSEADANREAARIGKAGFPTVIREVDLGEKGTWWRVYLGPYGTRDAAVRVAQEVKTTKVTDYAMVLRLPRVGAE